MENGAKKTRKGAVRLSEIPIKLKFNFTKCPVCHSKDIVKKEVNMVV